jgi:hypothetical protein
VIEWNEGPANKEGWAKKQWNFVYRAATAKPRNESESIGPIASQPCSPHQFIDVRENQTTRGVIVNLVDSSRNGLNKVRILGSNRLKTRLFKRVVSRTRMCKT